MKTCTKCGAEKPIEMFYARKKSRDGHTSECKECIKAATAAWAAANPERKKASLAAWNAENHDRKIANNYKWNAENPEKFSASKKKWVAANSEKIKNTRDKWRAANKERESATTSAWKASNPDKRRSYDQSRRANKMASGGKLSPGIAKKLFKLQRGKCACGCGQPLGDDYHLDHCMPLALGGSNTDDNIQLLTATCNLKKGAKHPVVFMQLRGFLL